MKTLITLVVAVLLAVQGLARDWTNAAGKCLVLVDREGKVLSHSYEGETYVGPTKVMNDLGAKLAK